ncbi:MAG: hypothetical protein K0R91_836, partial [Nitrososphaeraceae archaeon]|nr:hypothetical protein [Nitrososphaeraceae archaeon]
AQIHVKQSPNEKYNDREPVYSANMTKLEVIVGVRPVTPIIVSWTSSSKKAWNNGKTRTITGDSSDRDDPRFAVRQLEGSLKILGDGTAELSGKGRMYVFKRDVESALAKKTEYLWQPNLEVSYDVKVDEILSSGKRFINIGGCTHHFTDHEGNSNGRNYSVVGRYDGSGVGFKKETIHGCYDEYETNPMKLKLGQWYNIKYKQTVLEPDKKIKLEGWIDDQPIGTLTDSGQMTKDECAAPVVGKDSGALYYPIKDSKQVWTAGAYSGLYLRFTGTVKTYIKNLSVREF